MKHFFFQADKVTVVYPMRFNDSIDIVLATSFLQVWFLRYHTSKVIGINESRERDTGLFLLHFANHSCVVLCYSFG